MKASRPIPTPKQIEECAEELQIASTRPDGTLRPFVTIWMARVGESVYVRSAHGEGNGWYRRALDSGTGRIRAGGVDAAATFAGIPADDSAHGEIDAVYRAKYARYPASYTDAVVSASAHAATLRVDAATLDG